MRQVSRGLLGAAALSIISMSSGFAADMPAKGPVYKAVPVAATNWTGFYVGGNVGYVWGTANNDFAFSQPVFVGGNSVMAASDSNRLSSLIGGGQLGYNWQVNNILVGLEADLQSSSQKKSGAFSGGITQIFPTLANPATVTYSTKLDWLSTVRARLGVVSGPWLAYATGGVAIGKVNTNGVFTPAAAAAGPNAPGSWDQSTTKTGWTLGLGVENALTSNWSWKLEYLYVNLGSVTGSGAVGATNCYGSVGICANTSAAGTAGMTTKITDNIVRVGVNYKFAN